MSIDEEKISVFEIISDLERQLDAAFSMKEAQDEEITKLKDALAKIESRLTVSDDRNRELKGMLASQEELSAELEFLENERLEAGEKLRFAEESLQKNTVEKKGIEGKAESLARELEARSVRIEQVEMELDSANKTIQSFQNQIALLEDEKEELLAKLDKESADSSDMVVERDKAKRDLERAKESLDEIRLMLAETRSKTREQYYKKTAKK
jgi:chromosome segregation ATPase